MALADRNKAALILGGLLAFEGTFVAWAFYPHPAGFLRYMGFLPGRHNPSPLGWATAAIVAGIFLWLSRGLASVRSSMFRFDGLKLLAICMALASGVLEEWLFRGIVMDGLQGRGFNPVVQVLASAIAFGLMHSVWALFRGAWKAGLAATLATAGLGAGLALAYLGGHRSLAPVVSAHLLINALCEPGLVLAAVRGEMSRLKPVAAAAA